MRVVLIFGWILFAQEQGLAGTVRTLKTNESIMKTVRLSLGQSTVLRFRDKPKKVIVGNQNYFNIEFVGNDLAIQPLASVDSNLFVYCDYGRVYGFILKVKNSHRYDDLINVKWKPKSSIQLKKKAKVLKRQNKIIAQSFKLGEKLQIRINSVLKNEALNLYFIDMEVSNLTKEELSLKNLEVTVTRSKKKLSGQRLVVMDELLKAQSKTKLRVLLKLKKKSSFSLQFKQLDQSKKIIIQSKYL